MSKEISHSVVLIITTLFVFFIGYTPLSQFDLQIAAVLFIILYISKKFIIPRYPQSYLMESMIFTYVILQTINSTGGVHSAYFFLLYFLLFAVSLLLEPVIAITSTLAFIIFFLTTLSPVDGMNGIVPIISLACITPFAMYMGTLYRKNKEEEDEIRNLKKSITNKKANTFLFLSSVIKNHLSNIDNAVDSFMGDHQLGEIKRNTKRMRTLIDSYEKKEL